MTLSALLAGVALAACLVPQILKLITTKSARDLSYLFLFLFNAGLVLTLVYLIFEGATVAWACICVEIGAPPPSQHWRLCLPRAVPRPLPHPASPLP